MSTTGDITAGGASAAQFAGTLAGTVGVREASVVRARGWFTRAVTRYMRTNLERLRGAAVSADADIPELARKTTTRAALVSAGGGALTGAISTAAALVTAQTEGVAGFIAVPLAGAAIGFEMVWRSAVHVRLTCDLAHLFKVRFDPDDTDDLMRLYALAFGTHQGEEEEDEGDLGKGVLEKVSESEGEDIGERIGRVLLGESVMRNVLPVVGIFTSAITNYLVTKRLGDTVRRYLRYQRAMSDAIAHAELTCEKSKLLLIEGMWFIFTADGVLSPEEAGCLSHLLSDLPPEDRAALRARFTDDEIDWMGRVKEQVPEDQRDAFLYALQVAAALDKEVSLPERKIIKRVALMFGRPFEPERLSQMIEQLEEKGVLTPPEALASA